MYVSLCSVLPQENWSAYMPNKGNFLLNFYLLYMAMYNGRQKIRYMCVWCTSLGGAVVRLTVSRQNGI